MMIFIAAMLLAQAAPAPAVEAAPAAEAQPAAAPAAVAEHAAAPAEKVCRTRFKTGQGLIGSMRQIKVCKTKAEWATLAERAS